jgi:hypothetical protein
MDELPRVDTHKPLVLQTIQVLRDDGLRNIKVLTSAVVGYRMRGIALGTYIRGCKPQNGFDIILGELIRVVGPGFFGEDSCGQSLQHPSPRRDVA